MFGGDIRPTFSYIELIFTIPIPRSEHLVSFLSKNEPIFLGAESAFSPQTQGSPYFLEERADRGRTMLSSGQRKLQKSTSLLPAGAEVLVFMLSLLCFSP